MEEDQNEGMKLIDWIKRFLGKQVSVVVTYGPKTKPVIITGKCLYVDKFTRVMIVEEKDRIHMLRHWAGITAYETD